MLTLNVWRLSVLSDLVWLTIRMTIGLIGAYRPIGLIISQPKTKRGNWQKRNENRWALTIQKVQDCERPPGCLSMQGRSDGGGYRYLYPPPKKKSAQVNFLRGKNDVRTANQQFYTSKKTFIPPKQISGYAPVSMFGEFEVRSETLMSDDRRVLKLERIETMTWGKCKHNLQNKACYTLTL